MGIYSKSALPESDLKRNTFDLSFQNNLTTNFGVLKPVFFKEVLPGDTWDIDTTFGFRFMPTVFPIQNRAKASVKFFYVRTRSLYEDFKEWSTGNDEKLDGLPYLNPTFGQTTSMFRTAEDVREFFKNGGLADSLGLPVSVTYPSGAPSAFNYILWDTLPRGLSVGGATPLFPLALKPEVSEFSGSIDDFSIDTSTIVDTPYVNTQDSSFRTFIPATDGLTSSSTFASYPIRCADAPSNPELLQFGQIISGYLGCATTENGVVQSSYFPRWMQRNSGRTLHFATLGDFVGNFAPTATVTSRELSVLTGGTDFYSWCQSHNCTAYPVYLSCSNANSLAASRYYVYAVGDPLDRDSSVTIKLPTVNYDDVPPSATDFGNTFLAPAILLVYQVGSITSDILQSGTNSKTYGTWFEIDDEYVFSSSMVSALYDSYQTHQNFQICAEQAYTESVNVSNLVSQGTFTTTGIPWFNNEQKISALPFRAYELVYNAFYRDERNNPFQIDGVSYYDKFLPTTKGGADETRYELHHVNWEQDQFTTALPSPQQGAAPLVGISSTGVATVVDTDGTPVQVQLETADDGDTVVSYSQTSDLSPAVQRTLVNAATSGISINDFRAVNALQRYLEKNLRQGLRYKDMIQSRWGVSPSYSELNMPEFIGGVVEDVIPAQVNNNNGSSTSEPLGSYAGQLYCQGSSKHKIHKFCDEPGYIIGILDVTPVPVYNSLLPKHFRKFDVLDYFNPEFGHIGYQPIRLGELAPNTCVSNTATNMDTIFGYQRAWYEYLSSNDEVHGDFRGSLRDFVIYRDFVNPPTLSEQFLTVSDDETNNIFSVQTDADGKEIDKILGQLYFDVKVKRPIPRFGIPRLE